MQKKEVIISLTKSTFGAIPFAGTAFNELIFNYNGRIKQNRLNRFVELLSEYFVEENQIEIDRIKSEDFNDLFEAVLKKVVCTKSDSKLKRFRDILVKELKEPAQQTETNDFYLDLIAGLSEEEIIILIGHLNYDQNYYDKLESISKMNSELIRIQEERKKHKIYVSADKDEKTISILYQSISESKQTVKDLKRYSLADNYSLTKKEFTFHKQRLYSKGLLIDEGVGGIGVRTFEMMKITEFGIDFVEFLKNNNCR